MTYLEDLEEEGAVLEILADIRERQLNRSRPRGLRLELGRGRLRSHLQSSLLFQECVEVRLGTCDLLFDLCFLSSCEESALNVEAAYLRLDLAVILLNQRFALHVIGFLLVCRLLHGVHILYLAFLRVFIDIGLAHFLFYLVQAEATSGDILDTDRWVS